MLPIPCAQRALLTRSTQPTRYVLYPDEGHGWARPPNRIDFNGRTEQFLAEHLGGRAEKFTETEGATATFPLLEDAPAPAAAA